MILDVLQNAEQYHHLNKGFATAFDFLKRDDIKTLAPGRHEIDGDQVFAIVENMSGISREEAELESHQKYIDIQMVLDGVDTMGWKATSNCTVVTREYNLEADIQFYADEPVNWVPVTPGMFTIFFPGDAHMPRISSGHLHKVIAKVSI